MTSNGLVTVCVFAAVSCLAACPLEGMTPDPTTVDPPTTGNPPDDPPDAPLPDDSTPGDPTDPYLMDINNTWEVRGEAERTFTFQVTPSGAWRFIAFDGVERLAGADVRQLDGRLDNGRVHFTATMDTSVLAFDGIVTEDRTIHLRGNGDLPHIVLCATPCNGR